MPTIETADVERLLAEEQVALRYRTRIHEDAVARHHLAAKHSPSEHQDINRLLYARESAAADVAKTKRRIRELEAELAERRTT